MFVNINIYAIYTIVSENSHRAAANMKSLISIDVTSDRHVCADITYSNINPNMAFWEYTV